MPLLSVLAVYLRNCVWPGGKLANWPVCTPLGEIWSVFWYKDDASSSVTLRFVTVTLSKFCIITTMSWAVPRGPLGGFTVFCTVMFGAKGYVKFAAKSDLGVTVAL